MTTTMHPSAMDLEAYVTAGLERTRALDVEDHVAECAACAEALAGEARLEIAMGELAQFRAGDARAVSALPGSTRARPSVIVYAAMIAAAAVFMLIAGRWASPVEPPAPQPAAVSDPAADAGVTLARDDGGGAGR
jgi:hypothetical protein